MYKVSFFALRFKRRTALLLILFLILSSGVSFAISDSTPTTSFQTNFQTKGELKDNSHIFTPLAYLLAGRESNIQSQHKTERYHGIENQPFYQKYAKKMDKLYRKLHISVLNKIPDWRQRNIPASAEKYKRYPVFYPLSGADFINLYLFYPDALEYTMIAMENKGELIEANILDGKHLTIELNALYQSVHSYATQNYFQSKIMERSFHNSYYAGVLPRILIFMAWLDMTIVDIQFISIDKKGNFIYEDLISTKRNYLNIKGHQEQKKLQKYFYGFRISFRDTTQPHDIRHLTYLSSRMSNQSIDSRNSFGKFFQNMPQSRILLKSAVYLFQMQSFQQLAKFLAKRAVMIIQDDSGFAYAQFSPKYWERRIYGRYLRFPIKGTMYRIQKDLHQEYDKIRPKPLSFHFGYGILKGKNNSNLMILIKK